MGHARADGARMTPGDRPDARELVEAVAVWLAADLAPSLDRGPRFQAMVAAQALAIAARELDLAAGHAAADREAFAPLVGGADDPHRALAEALRRGDHDDRLDELAPILHDHVRRKLEIARPGY
jgi:Domain of unknown function (DUF6285)